MGKNNKKKKHVFRKIIIGLLVLILLFLGGFYYLFTDKNRSSFVPTNTEISEIVKKHYIDGFKDIKNTGIYDFKLEEDEVNELLSNVTKKINIKQIENIYYVRNESENTHSFYVDINIPVIKTRIAVDTKADVNDFDHIIYLDITNISVGKVKAKDLIIKSGKIDELKINQYLSSTGLPVSFNKSRFALIVNPMGFINRISGMPSLQGMMFELAKCCVEAIKVNPANLGFKIDFSYLTSQTIDTVSTTPVDLMDKVSTSFNSLNYESLNVGERVNVASLTNIEFTDILNDSFEKYSEPCITSTLTSNSYTIELEKVNAYFESATLIDLDYIVSINGYKCNLLQKLNVSSVSNEQDFELHMYLSNSLYSGGAGNTEGALSTTDPIMDLVFERVANKYPDAFRSNSTMHQLDINLSSMIVSKPSLEALKKEVVINVENSSIDFNVIK